MMIGDDYTREEKGGIARRAFASLAQAQRAGPERLAASTRANPGLFNATGAFTYLAEHIGDLTNRLTENDGSWTSFGYATVGEKVRRALRYFRNGYGLGSEIEANLRANYRVHLQDKAGLRYSAFRAEFERAAVLYADAHAGLTVWNEAQWHAREAAVALGRLDFTEMEHHLNVLEQHLDSGVEAWAAWAGQTTFVEHELVPYVPEHMVDTQASP